MSKFLSIIEELLKPQLTPAEKERKKNQNVVDAAIKRVQQGSKDPTDLAIAKQSDVNKKKALQAMKQMPKEAEGDEEPVEDPAAEAEPAQAQPLKTEGERYLVNLARLALHADIDDSTLTSAERELFFKEVESGSEKDVEKAIVDYLNKNGLTETFDDKYNKVFEDLKKNSKIIVFVPGSFKPPHKGHYEMVKKYSDQYPQAQIRVLISAPSPKSIRRTKDGKIITPAVAEQIFELYVSNLNNVEVIVSDYPSPVTSVYESFKDLEPGTTVVLGASKKDNDWKRWLGAGDWAAKNGLELDVLNPEDTAVDVTVKPDGTPYSASNIRDNFDDFEQIKGDIPEHVSPESIKSIFDAL